MPFKAWCNGLVPWIARACACRQSQGRRQTQAARLSPLPVKNTTPRSTTDGRLPNRAMGSEDEPPNTRTASLSTSGHSGIGAASKQAADNHTQTRHEGTVQATTPADAGRRRKERTQGVGAERGDVLDALFLHDVQHILVHLPMRKSNQSGQTRGVGYQAVKVAAFMQFRFQSQIGSGNSTVPSRPPRRCLHRRAMP